MGERAVEPGRYAQHPDGSWHPFTDKAELDFKPVVVVTVKAPIARDEPIAVNVDVAAAEQTSVTVETRAAGKTVQKIELKREPKAHPFDLAFAKHDRVVAAGRAAQSRRSPIDPHLTAQVNRTATPADVFRAVADQFGILPATGNHRSCARFKPLVRRDEEAEAALAFERGVEERQARR